MTEEEFLLWEDTKKSKNLEEGLKEFFEFQDMLSYKVKKKKVKKAKKRIKKVLERLEKYYG